MAAERVYITQTILNVKRALEVPSDASESEDEIAVTSNRGRKLKRGARYVNEGALDNRGGRGGYKEEVDYYGKSKSIIYRKPGRRKRVLAVEDEDEEEDEGERSEESEEDPYSEVQIDKLLAPLESAADLPSHPALSHIYTSHTLDDLVQQSHTKVGEEHKHTVVLKNLLTKFLGDDPWVNLEKMEVPMDDYMAQAQERGEALFRDYAYAPQHGMPKPDSLNGQSPEEEEEEEEEEEGEEEEGGQQRQEAEINGDEAAPNSAPATNGEEPAVEVPMADNEGEDAPVLKDSEDPIDPDETLPDALNLKTELPPSPSPEPRRMTTRSLNAPPPPPPAEPASPDQTSIPTPPVDIDPFFLPPVHIIDRNFGLPAQEAEDTRRLLVASVQRQDEFMRGLNKLRQGLLRAQRLKRKVWEWCRIMEGMRDYHNEKMETAAAAGGATNAKTVNIEEADGVGLTDDEDWYDMQRWGLEEGLGKGMEEEDDIMDSMPQKKTRRNNK